MKFSVNLVTFYKSFFINYIILFIRQVLAICVVVLGLIFMLVFHVFVKEPSIPVEIDTMSDDELEQESLVSNVKKPRFVQKTTSDWFKTPLFYKVFFISCMFTIFPYSRGFFTQKLLEDFYNPLLNYYIQNLN